MSTTVDRPFVPSLQQKEFFDFVQHRRMPDGSTADTGSCTLESVAGSGKTETLVRAMGLMRGSVAAMAFNKSAARELKERATERGVMRNGIFISTAHGAGYSTFARWLRQNDKPVNVAEHKTGNILDRMVAEGNTDVESHAMFIKRMVSLGKQMLGGVKWDIWHRKPWFQLLEHYDCDSDLPDNTDLEAAVKLVREVFIASGQQCADGIIDFDDMIWAPLANNCRFFTNDWVLVDECQDTNPSRRELARRMLKPGGRFVGVGDSRQAIYGFTGASSDAMLQVQRDFKAVQLGLTVSYRCPQAVVRYAHRWVSHIQAHADAPEGVVRSLEVSKAEGGKRQTWFAETKFEPTDAILCRYTKPLITSAYALLKAGIACRVEGRDIGLGLINLAKRWKVKSATALENKLLAWAQREILKARKAKSEAKEQAVIDKVETLQIFIERCRLLSKAPTVECVVHEIEDMFADDIKGVLTLSTIHKAKGREWPRMFWLQQALKTRELKDHEAVQEENLNYVATTRAKFELVLVPEGIQ